MVDRCLRTDSSRCDPSRIYLDLWSRVIWLGPQLEESFLPHLSTIRFSLSPHKGYNGKRMEVEGPYHVMLDHCLHMS